MSVAWSWAFDTPFKWTKQVASHFGGTRQGMAISWPGHIKDAGGIRNQFHHVIDIVPTILEATGIKAPEHGRRHRAETDRRREHGLHVRRGECQRARRRARPSISRCSATAHLSRRLDRRHDATAACALADGRASCPTSHGYKWELYNITEDYSEDNDLAAKMPDKLKRDAGALPDGGGEVPRLPAGQLAFQRAIAPRPSATAGRTDFTYSGVIPGHSDRQRAEYSEQVLHHHRRDGRPAGRRRGMLVTAGGRFGGYGLYLLKGKPVFIYNFLDLGALPLGRRRGRPRLMGDSLRGQAHDRLRLHL